MKHIFIYLLHEISPSLQIELKFTDQNEDPVIDRNMRNLLFGRGGVIQYKEFKVFFAAVNVLIPPPPTSTHLN